MVLLRFVAAWFCLLACSAAFADDPLPRARPEEVGLSSERMARISAVLKADIEAGRIPGAVIAIARRGKLVALDAYGWRDKAAGVAMTTDTIFNIASMTKPMTAVGGLMLYEQGKLLIDDPLSKYFPKFASMKVAVRDNGEAGGYNHRQRCFKRHRWISYRFRPVLANSAGRGNKRCPLVS